MIQDKLYIFNKLSHRNKYMTQPRDADWKEALIGESTLPYPNRTFPRQKLANHYTFSRKNHTASLIASETKHWKKKTIHSLLKSKVSRLTWLENTADSLQDKKKSTKKKQTAKSELRTCARGENRVARGQAGRRGSTDADLMLFARFGPSFPRSARGAPRLASSLLREIFAALGVAIVTVAGSVLIWPLLTVISFFKERIRGHFFPRVTRKRYWSSAHAVWDFEVSRRFLFFFFFFNSIQGKCPEASEKVFWSGRRKRTVTNVIWSFSELRELRRVVGRISRLQCKLHLCCTRILDAQTLKIQYNARKISYSFESCRVLK